MCEPFHTALTEILEALPSIIDKRTRDFIKDYVESRKVMMANEISKLAGLLSEREKYVGLLEEIEKNELFRTRENDDRKSQIRAEIACLSHESVEEFSSFVAETINVDALVKRLFRTCIKEFWKNTEDAFNKAAAMLDADWDDYVANLRNTVKEYNVPELQHKVEVLKYLSEFLDRIPL